MTCTRFAIFVRVLLSSLLLVAGGACTYMPVMPDDRVGAFDRLVASDGVGFDTALLVVSGAYLAYDARVPGARLSVEKRAWTAVENALIEKNIAKRVTGSNGDGDLQLLCEFVVEDDLHPMHRTFSMLTLYTFPLWKMVRLTVRARIVVKGETLSSFNYESEILEYRSPLFLLALPFNGPKPAARLFDHAARALAVHLARVTVRFRGGRRDSGETDAP